MQEHPKSTKDQTRTRILNAAKTVLADSGFGSFGVNTVAREAGCDKVLIYRYFGGVEGLAEALGQDLGLWLPMEAAGSPSPSYPIAMGRLLKTYLQALRRTPLVKRILAWEIQETNALTAKLGAAKSISIQSWFENIRRQTEPAKPAWDAPAINAILIAAAHHLALREDHDGSFAGLDLKDPNTWARIDAAFDRLTTKAFAQTPSGEENAHA